MRREKWCPLYRTFGTATGGKASKSDFCYAGKGSIQLQISMAVYVGKCFVVSGQVLPFYAGKLDQCMRASDTLYRASGMVCTE